MKKSSPYRPLGCTFRELLLCCDPVKVAAIAALKDLDTHIDTRDDKKKSSIDLFLGQMAGYDNAIVEILGNDSCETRPMGWAVDLVKADKYDDGDWVNIHLYNWNYVKPPKNLDISKWSDDNWQTFSSSFSDWSEHADREIMVTDEVLEHCDSLSELAGEIMWEVTFCGFTGKAVAERGDEILGECKAAMEAYRAEHPLDKK
jgi:hypothetical protein